MINKKKKIFQTSFKFGGELWYGSFEKKMKKFSSIPGICHYAKMSSASSPITAQCI